jgi:hypothetical protein
MRQSTNALNGVGDMNDGSGTINPAALNASGMYFVLLAHLSCLSSSNG